MITQDQIIVRLLLAALLGSLIGLERERLDWAAGLRTHMLVCVGAALFMIVSAHGFTEVLSQSDIVLDPSRVAAQVVSGIGFLGAGTIILRRDVILGLTTAASLWAIAAIGLAVGGGLYIAAVCTTVIALFILAGVKPLEQRIFRNRRNRTLRLTMDRETSIAEVEGAIKMAGLQLKQIIVQNGKAAHKYQAEISLRRTSIESLLPLIEKLRAVPGVREVSSSDS